MSDISDTRIVRCYGCEAQVRAFATRMEPTGDDGELERWCIGCLDGINDYSASLIHDKQAALGSLEQAVTNVLLDEGVSE